MPDTVNGLLKSKLPVHGHEYDVCQNGCKLFKMNDDSDDSCEFCKKGRYSADEKKKGPNNENHIHWRSPGGYVVQPKDS